MPDQATTTDLNQPQSASSGLTVTGELDALVKRLVAAQGWIQARYEVDMADRLNNPQAVRERDLSRRQDLAREQLAAVATFLHSPAFLAAHPDMLRFAVGRGFYDLLDAMSELVEGVRPALFEMPKGRKRKASPSDEWFRARVVATLDVLELAGDTTGKAAGLIAHTLNQAGRPIPRGSKSEEPQPFKQGTVTGWRKELRERGEKTDLYRAHAEVMATANEMLPACGGSWAKVAKTMLDGLRLSNPAGPFHELVFVPPSGPEK